MAMKMAYRLLKRQVGGDNNNSSNNNSGNGTSQSGSGDDNDDWDGADDDGYYDSWWWSSTGMAVRYTIVVLIFASILLYFVGGWYHAQSRVRKGLPPKAYHAWMVRRYYRQHPPHDPYFHHGRPQQEAYAMPNYPPPPPAYNQYTAPPPAYQPPEGASKALADQNFPDSRTYRAEEQGQGSRSIT